MGGGEPRPDSNLSLRKALLLALVAGFYVATFYTTNNLTLLRLESVLLVFTAMIGVALGVAIVAYAAVAIAGLQRWSGLVVVFSVSLFLFALLRPAFIGVDGIEQFFSWFGGRKGLLANALFVSLPAFALSLIFRRKPGNLVVVLIVMTISAVALNAGKVADGLRGTLIGQDTERAYEALRITETPNMYFVLADGYASVAYMRQENIDNNDFLDFLRARRFRVYEDTFSNYHPTVYALPAILNMEHNYYRLSGESLNFSEVNRASRLLIAGDNNVTRIFKRNGYTSEYIHSSNYLLLQGCRADYCFPKSDGLSGAKMLFSSIFRINLLSNDDLTLIKVPDEEFVNEVKRANAGDKPIPTFQYIHYYNPGHAPNDLAGRCDMERERTAYVKKLAVTHQVLTEIIAHILSEDPGAVIVLAGDHGPFIANRCHQLKYIDRLQDYRDRVGAILAIRWPEGYTGRFDTRLKTGVNWLRYVLAELVDDDGPLLNTAQQDDVFARAGRRVIQIIEDGVPLGTPRYADGP